MRVQIKHQKYAILLIDYINYISEIAKIIKIQTT